MGCDIHAMYERKEEHYWINSGDPNIGRNYHIFSVLGNVRNYENRPFIREDRIELYDNGDIKGDFSSQFCCLSESYGEDGHSHSFVTLAEIKAFNVNQILFGEVKVFDPWDNNTWYRLIGYGETIRKNHSLTDDEVRLVFFFDN